MSDFVNYGKRGVELPRGCKDLIDLLPRPQSPSFPAEGLSDVQRYLSRFLEKPAPGRHLTIQCLPAWVLLSLFYARGALMVTTLVPSERERAVSALLSEVGITLIQDVAVTGGPCSRFMSFSLVPEAAEVERIISKLLRQGFGLHEDVVLEFDYAEGRTT
jgi:hypothetical protein